MQKVCVNAQIIGTGNGNPSSHTPDKSLVREAFNGLALAIVQSKAGYHTAQSVTVSASSPGLTSGRISINLVRPLDPEILKTHL